MLIKLNSRKPEDVINFINNNFPYQSKFIYYDKDEKQIISKDKSIVRCYFDPLHSVLDIKILKNVS